jgi:histidinol-phosphate aminotransferase
MEFWNARIKNLTAYAPGEQWNDPSVVKLNTNENPYPPSKKVISAIRKAATGKLRLYPDPNCTELKNEISRLWNVRENQIFIGNGSDEVLAFAFAAFFDTEKEILFPDVSYSFYPVYSHFYNLKTKTVPVDDDFNIKSSDYLQANNGIILPNPNAPTGKFLGWDELEKIVRFNLTIHKVVIIDEAYIDFGGQTCIDRIHQFPNLLVVQTLSKSRSLAGLRIGIAVGDKNLIEGLEKVKGSINSYTVDRLACAGALWALRDVRYFEKTRGKIIKTRDWVCEKLMGLGFRVLESKANFVFISHSGISGEEIYQQLKKNHILIRHFKNARINNFIRVTIGSDREMNRLIAEVEKILEERKSRDQQ